MIISVPEIVFFTSAMIIAGRKKIMFRPNTINLLPEKMIVMTDPIVSVREKALAGMSGNPAFAEVYEMKATAKLFVRSGRICLHRVRRHRWLFPPSRSVSRWLHDPGGEPQIGMRH